MRYSKIIIVFLTVLLTAVFLFAATQEEAVEPEDVSLLFSVRTGQNAEIIRCWENMEGEYVVFLPSYADQDQVFIIPGNARISIGDVLVTSGTSCRGFAMDKAYPFAYTADGRTLESTITFVKSENIPSLYIDVSSGNMEYIHMDKNHEESGTLRLYDPEGNSCYTGTVAALKGRGNTSWSAEKKPYNLTLSQDADLLGMGAAQRWVLLAEGFNPLNIRNKIVYDFAQEAGLLYSPDSEWVELYLNGEYAGLYLLTERNEVHEERVDIAQKGSFLISMENQLNMDNQKIPYVALDSTQVLRIRYASMSDQEIAAIWTSLENALKSEDGVDSETGKHWMDLIDLDSWVRKYLIEEVFANPDGGAVSQYFYLDGADPEKKIHAGPVWDYDYALGGEDFWLRNYDAFFVMAREYTNDGMYLPWFYELYQKEEFYHRLTEIYETEFLPQLEMLMNTYNDRYCTRITDAAETDGVRWGYSEEEILADISFIGNFLENRILFLSDLWIKGTQYYTVWVDTGRYLSGHFAVKNGDVLPALPTAEDLGGLGWYRVDSDVPVDVSQPVVEDMQIYMKIPETNLPVIHLMPLLAVIVILSGAAGVSIYRDKKNRSKHHDTAKAG